MNSIKELWKTFTAKTKSLYDRFVAVIQARLNKKNPTTTDKIFYVASVVTGVVAAIIALKFLWPVTAAITAALPFTGVLAKTTTLLAWTVPVAMTISGVVAKAVSFVISPAFTSQITPLKDLLSYPKELVVTFNWLITAVAFTGFAAVIVVVNVLNKLVWLGETIVKAPVELAKTGSLNAGFAPNMKAWLLSWTPKYFLDDSLGSITVKQFRTEEKARPAKKEPDIKVKMRPVTVPDF